MVYNKNWLKNYTRCLSLMLKSLKKYWSFGSLDNRYFSCKQLISQNKVLLLNKDKRCIRARHSKLKEELLYSTLSIPSKRPIFCRTWRRLNKVIFIKDKFAFKKLILIKFEPINFFKFCYFTLRIIHIFRWR